MSKLELLNQLVDLKNTMVKTAVALNSNGYSTSSSDLVGASQLLETWVNGVMKDAEKDFLNTTRINP